MAWAISTPPGWTTAIEQTKSVYEFVNAPDASLYFTADYLPSDGSLMLK